MTFKGQIRTASFPLSNVVALTASAFREAQQKYPNYGKAVNIGPKQWWTNVSANG